MSQASKLLKNTAIIAIGKLGTQIISYLLLPLYTTKLAVAEYGTYDMVCTLSLFLCPMITMLMEESMFRFLIDAQNKDERKKIIGQTIIYSLIGSLVFVILAFIILTSFSSYPQELITALILFVVSNVFINLSNALARGLGKIKLYSLSNFILGIGTIILIIVILNTNATAQGMLWANTIPNILTALFVFYKLKLKNFIGKFEKKITKKMIKYSVPLVPNSISWTIINMSDRLILTTMIDEEANGIYAMANRFPNIINVLYGYFYTAWKESAAQIIKEKDNKKYYDSIYGDMKRFLFAVTICLIAVMPFAFPIFIKEAYADSYIYIPIIMIATYFANLSSFYGGIFGAFKKTSVMGTTTFVAAAINLIIDLSLVKVLGIYAACISTLVADLIVYYYRKYKLNNLMKLKEVKMFGPMIILCMVCIAYYIKYIPDISEEIYWILNAITLVIAVVYSYAINRRFVKSITGKIINKFRRKK